MDYGLNNRIARMIRPSTGHSVMLACDHGYFMGPTRRLEDPRSTISPLVPYADVVSVTRGILRSSVDPAWDIPILLRVSGGTSILKEDLSDEGITTSMKDAVRLNATAVSISIFVGAPNERQTLLNLGKLVDEGEEYGMPVVAITAVGKELEKRDDRYLSRVQDSRGDRRAYRKDLLLRRVLEGRGRVPGAAGGGWGAEA